LVYLDHNATTPVAPEVVEAMLPFLRAEFGNPGSAHGYGRAPRRAVERAREQVAALIGASPEEILFTSSGTESNNTVLFGTAARGGHVVTSAIEHPAILEPCERLDATLVPVDRLGRVDPAAVAEALREDTVLVTVMHANNEVGTIEPIAEIAGIARERGIPVHTDAAQSVGKIPVNVDDLGVDYLTIAGHKLYAPKGVGALYVRRGRALPPLLCGGGQEGGRRAGTENVAGIVGLGRACELAREMDGSLRDRLWEGLRACGRPLRRNGDPEHVLPNTLSVSFADLDAAALLEEIGDEVAASTGAACHAGVVEPSAVLLAMGVPPDYLPGTIRFSLGRSTTAGEIDEAIAVVTSALP
jgi:cysteine desulfurase